MNRTEIVVESPVIQPVTYHAKGNGRRPGETFSCIDNQIIEYRRVAAAQGRIAIEYGFAATVCKTAVVYPVGVKNQRSCSGGDKIAGRIVGQDTVECDICIDHLFGSAPTQNEVIIRGKIWKHCCS